MSLIWRSHPDMHATLITSGVRGHYRIIRVGAEWWLAGLGHDRLDIWGLEPGGRPFPTLELAQEHAARIDETAVRESQISGT
ncbi:hypothetical protein [Mycobacterium sp. SMC-11]|uniref:hypothetical protein n=1 Tax=Mycobacterium sp. SMC-11 TaxID=3385969 RepID=UPI00390C7C7C